MTKADGQIRIDGVAVGEATINLLGPSVQLVAKYALCNTTTGEKLGAGTPTIPWSPATMRKLLELVASMERDIIQGIFIDAVVVGSEDEATYDEDGVPGL